MAADVVVLIATLVLLAWMLWRTYPGKLTEVEIQQRPMSIAWMAVLTEYAKDLGCDPLSAHGIAAEVFAQYIDEPVSDETARRMVADLHVTIAKHQQPQP